MEAQGILRKIAHHDVEDLIQEIIFHFVERAAFQDELAVSDKGENFPSAPRACRQPPQGGVFRVRSLKVLSETLVPGKDVQLHLSPFTLEQRYPQLSLPDGSSFLEGRKNSHRTGSKRKEVRSGHSNQAAGPAPPQCALLFLNSISRIFCLPRNHLAFQHSGKFKPEKQRRMGMAFGEIVLASPPACSIDNESLRSQSGQ